MTTDAGQDAVAGARQACIDANLLSCVMAIVRGLNHASGMASVFLYSPTDESSLGYAPPELIIKEEWWSRHPRRYPLEPYRSEARVSGLGLD